MIKPVAIALTQRPAAAVGATPTVQVFAGAISMVGISDGFKAGDTGCDPIPARTAKVAFWPDAARPKTSKPPRTDGWLRLRIWHLESYAAATMGNAPEFAGLRRSLRLLGNHLSNGDRLACVLLPFAGDQSVQSATTWPALMCVRQVPTVR